MKNVHGVPRENISFFKKQAMAQGSSEWQYQDQNKPSDDTVSEEPSEPSLIHLTCKEFEQRYPEVAESAHEASCPAEPDFKHIEIEALPRKKKVKPKKLSRNIDSPSSPSDVESDESYRA